MEQIKEVGACEVEQRTQIIFLRIDKQQTFQGCKNTSTLLAGQTACKSISTTFGRTEITQ